MRGRKDERHSCLERERERVECAPVVCSTLCTPLTLSPVSVGSTPLSWILLSGSPLHLPRLSPTLFDSQLDGRADCKVTPCVVERLHRQGKGRLAFPFLVLLAPRQTTPTSSILKLAPGLLAPGTRTRQGQ